MYSTFHGLEVGKRAILAQQTALTTTGHNIGNANTKGYTRQVAVLGATRPLAFPGAHNGTAPMQLGTGVEVSQLQRIRYHYLDIQYRNEQQKLGYWEGRAAALSELEGVFNEPNEFGLDMALNRFWQNMQELAKNPDSLPARAVLLASGQEVATNLNEISTGITQKQEATLKQLGYKAEEIKNALKEVATLNSQIAKNIALGKQPNDLLDQRDLLLDNLTKDLGVQIEPKSDGTVDLLIGGTTLVSGDTPSEFTIDKTTGEVKINDNPVNLDSGQIKGLQESLSYMTNLKSKIDTLALAIAKNINDLHSSDDAKNLSGASENLLLFVDKDDHTQPPKGAASMIVNPALLNAPQRIAAATSNGEGANALEMGKLQTQRIQIDGQTVSIGEFYHGILGQLGADVQTADRFRNNADMMAQQTDMQRQSISGVSIDEEMTNMVRYQQAYNAAAKYVSAVNEMLDKLINGMV
jgi:flagellar hook-associated protein 1